MTIPHFAFAVINNDEKIRLNSASGGAFSLFAREFIKRKGIVFGAQFDESFLVKHSNTDNAEGIVSFQGSKYIQSRIGETYRECKHYLNHGKHVLFSGTPCQIAGLKSFLGKEYNNLFCIDLVCRGVSSPKTWGKYLQYQEKRTGLKPESIVFKSKEYGWKQVTLHFYYPNNQHYFGLFEKDLFYQTMRSSVGIRPACFECKFKTVNRQSDVTLGCCQGVDECYPEMFDDKGTSLILIHSNKGERLFNDIKNGCIFIPVDVQLMVKYNPAIIRSSSLSNIQKKRKLYFKYLDILPFDVLVKGYVCDSNIVKIYRFIRKCLGKIKRILIKNINCIFSLEKA